MKKLSPKLEKSLLLIKKASHLLRSAVPERKNQVLLSIAAKLRQSEEAILKANEKDLKKLKRNEAPAFRDRLTLNSAGIAAMIESLEQVAEHIDPVGEVAELRKLANGLKTKRVRSPLGVIFMIFEARPNVAVEAFSLAFKAGNAVILRGGKESKETTSILYKIITEALQGYGFSENCLWGLTNPDRKIMSALLKCPQYIDVVVPRGGEGLIDFVVKNSEIPLIKNDRGLCHLYVHEDADLKMALAIATNAKTQRPGVCNSIETLLVHEKVAVDLLPLLYEQMESLGVQWFVDGASEKTLKKRAGVKKASKKNWDTEYLDLKINCRVVKSLNEALEHIEKHGSRHSESIITKSESVARKFQADVDAAAVYWNASTRFTDGFELGLGGELGISTQKLHVRGPVGLKELTSLRWIIDGDGQIRS